MRTAMHLEGKSALVTGGSSGIGRGIAIALAQQGARVAITYRERAVKAEAVIAELNRLGEGHKAFQVDVADSNSVERMVNEVLAEFGKLDVLVNNAGIASACPVVEMKLEDWDHTVSVDLRGVFLCTRLVLSQMISRKSGCVISVAGELAHTGGEGYAHLSAAKAGVVAFSKSLAREVGRYGIRVNVISPGPIRTELLDSVAEHFMAKKFSHIPLGFFGEPEDIGNAAVFLASENSRYLTGQTIVVNGGNFML